MKNFFISILLFFSFSLIAQKKKINDIAPDITVTDWVHNVPLDKSLKNKYIVLEFWATWCAPCLKAVSHLNEIQSKVKRDDIYFISITNENVDKIKKIINLLDFKSIVVSDRTNQTQKEFSGSEKGLEGIPMTILIDKNGLIKWIGLPNDLNNEILSKFLNNKLETDQQTFENNQLNSEKYLRQLNDFGVDTDGNYLNKLLKLATDESIQYLLDIRNTDDEVNQIDSKLNKRYFGTNSIDIKNLLWCITEYNINQILISDNLLNRKYQVFFKTVNPSFDIENQFLNALSLSKQKVEILSKVNVIKYNDSKLLVSPSSKITDKTYFDNKTFFSNYSLKDLIDEINKSTSQYFFIDKDLKKKYDFIIDFTNLDSILNSLKSYGFLIEVEYKTIQAYKYEQN